MVQTAVEHPHSNSYARRTLRVLKAWFKQPSQVATICPSSPQLLREIAERECVRNAERVIELGPGAGGTTLALLEQMRPDAGLLAVEKTRDLAEALKAIDDDRLIDHCGDAADLISICHQHDFHPVDVVVSGIPFSALPRPTAEQIMNAVAELLRPGGRLIAYQLHDDVQRYAAPLFSNPSIRSVPLNLPPLKVFCWTKA